MFQYLLLILLSNIQHRNKYNHTNTEMSFQNFLIL
jgi:hypothetical protein